MKLVVDEGRVYGARYYTVKPELDTWTEVFWKDGAHSWRNMLEWCVETYGPAGDLWDSTNTPHRWYANSAKFWFRNEQDLTIFTLRWA